MRVTFRISAAAEDAAVWFFCDPLELEVAAELALPGGPSPHPELIAAQLRRRLTPLLRAALFGLEREASSL